MVKWESVNISFILNAFQSGINRKEHVQYVGHERLIGKS